MDWVITKAADSTCDTESRSDLPRSLPRESPAEIGDSITIHTNGDRIKVTVLGVVDPAVIKSRGIKGTLAMLLGEGEDDRQDVRRIAVMLRMRNLEDASEQGVVQGICGGVLFDSNGHEYPSTGDNVENCPSVWVPNRGQQPKVMCDTFEIPEKAKPALYALATSGGGRAPAGEWRLKRSRQASIEWKPDYGLKAQRQLLETGVKAWNAWRKAHPKVEVHLASENLNGRDLKGIDLSRANLEGTNFAGSDLTNANFSQAHARSALFPKAKVSSADFSECDLRRASFFEAYADQHTSIALSW